MDADLVLLAAADEPGVEDEEVIAGRAIVIGGVVAGRAIAGGRRRRLAGNRKELPVAHQLHAERRDRRVVEKRAGGARDVGEVVAGRIEVRTVRVA
jgi:hypothetical protein